MFAVFRILRLIDIFPARGDAPTVTFNVCQFIQ